MKRILFSVTFFDSGVAKYVAGQHYEPSDDTRICVARGIAQEVDVPDAAAAAETGTAAKGQIDPPDAGEPAATAPAPVASKKK